MPGSATKQPRIGRPSSERIGMFCRLGLVDESRPVAARTWLKVVWIRPVRGLISARQRVEVGVLELRHLAPALDLGDDLVLVADLGEDPGVGRVAGLARVACGSGRARRRAPRPSCCGEPIVNSCPASSQISSCRLSASPASESEIFASRSVSSFRPSRSIAARTSISGSSTSSITRSSSSSASFGRWRAASSQASRASSAVSAPCSEPSSESWPSSSSSALAPRSPRRRPARAARRCAGQGRSGRRRRSCRGRAAGIPAAALASRPSGPPPAELP